MIFSMPLREARVFPWSRKARHARERIGADAAALLGNANDPYHEARNRMRQADSQAEARHWSQVAVQIAKATGKEIGLDTATRMYWEADFSEAPSASHRIAPTMRLSTSDVSDDDTALLELKKLMEVDVLRLYRLQFLGPSNSFLSNIVEEREIRARDAATAVDEMRDLEWPSGAISVRVIDTDGVVLDERHRFE